MSSKNRIITVPAFSDNYIWLICDENKKYAAIVDPGDATPVIEALEKDSIQPVAILITHFHADHVGGIGKLLKKYPDLPVYGPASETIPHITRLKKAITKQVKDVYFVVIPCLPQVVDAYLTAPKKTFTIL